MLITIVCSLVLIALDQLFKWLAVQYLMPAGTIDVLPGVVGLQYVENTGAAFNIFAGRQTFLIVITAAALLVILYILLFRRPKLRMEYISFLLIFAGGVGNLIDRVANGYVVDYINLLFMRFAVFNFADCLVCVGFALLILSFILSEVKAKREKQAAEAEIGHTSQKEQEPGEDGTH